MDAGTDGARTNLDNKLDIGAIKELVKSFVEEEKMEFLNTH